jgi:hypothetical protein
MENFLKKKLKTTIRALPDSSVFFTLEKNKRLRGFQINLRPFLECKTLLICVFF